MPFDESRLPGPRRGAGERAINLPPVLLWLIGINVAIQVVRELLPDQLDLDMMQQFGLVPAAYTSGAGPDMLSLLLAPITYQFVHGGWMHLGINMITLAAFGVPVVRVLGARRFLLFYLSAGIVAGFVHVFFFPDSADPVVGASGAISGVFGEREYHQSQCGNCECLEEPMDIFKLFEQPHNGKIEEYDVPSPCHDKLETNHGHTAE